MEATKRLIEIVNQEPQLRNALEQVCEFKWVRINELSKQQLDMLEEEGFRFHRNTLGSRKEDIKQFLKVHPECRAGDTNAIIDAIGFRLLLEDDTEPETSTPNFEAEMRHQERMQERRRRTQQKSKPLEDEDDSSPLETIEESEDEVPKKKSKKKLHK